MFQKKPIEILAPDEQLLKEIEQELARRGLTPDGKPRALLPAEFKDNPEDAFRFITTYVKTLEETSRERMSIPAHDYLYELTKEWYACRGTRAGRGKVGHCIKSRRLIVSWYVGALELYACLIKPLTFAIGAEVFEGINGSRQFVYRAFVMYDGLRKDYPEWKLPEAVTIGSKSDNELDTFALPHGSRIIAANAQEGKFQGAGVYGVRFEELSHKPNAKKLVAQSQILTQGPGGKQVGFTFTISNAYLNDNYLEMVLEDPETIPDYILDPMEPVKRWTSKERHRVIAIHYSADPNKGSDWADEAKIGNADWEREMEGRLEATGGKLVLPEFRLDYHVAKKKIQPVVSASETINISGMDCSTSTIHFAEVTLQLFKQAPGVYQIWVLKAHVSDPGDLRGLLEKVKFSHYQMLRRKCEYYVGDPAGVSKDRNGASAFDDIRAAGIPVTKGCPNSPITIRVNAMKESLVATVSCPDGVERPLIKFCPVGAKDLIKAIRQGYRYRTQKVGDEFKEVDIVKNRASDLVDAFAYAVHKALEVIKEQQNGNSYSPEKVKKTAYKQYRGRR